MESSDSCHFLSLVECALLTMVSSFTYHFEPDKEDMTY
jgi:hypothetical protein